MASTLGNRMRNPAALAVLLAVIVVASCDRSPTAPLTRDDPQKRFNLRPERYWTTAGGEDNSSTSGTADALEPTSAHDGTQPAKLIPGNFTYRTIVNVTVVGSIHRATVIGPFNFGDYGVTGSGAAPGDGSVWFNRADAGSATAVPGSNFNAVFQSQMQYGRNGSAARPSNTNPSCGNNYISGDPDCLEFSASAATQLSYTTYDVSLTSQVDASSVKSHELARFDIAPGQASIGDFAVAVDGIEWMWVPDDTTDGPPTSVSCGRHCEKFIDGSGTMFVRAYVNGTMKPGTPMHVSVTDHVDLTVDRPLGPANYLATFVVRNSDSTDVLVDYWKFIPDTSTDYTVWCSSWSQGEHWSCPKTVEMSGTMEVRVSVHYNHWVVKRKHVAVIPCPTGDSLLDDPTVRAGLKSIWDSSFAGNSDQSQRRERAGRLLDSAGVRKFVFFPLNSNDALNNACTVTPSQMPPGSNTPGWTIIAIFHSHPFTDGEVYTQAICPGGADGRTGYGYTPRSGIPSGFDWNQSKLYGVPGYVIDAKRITRYRGDSAQVLLKDESALPADWDWVVPDWKQHVKEFKRTSECSLLLALDSGSNEHSSARTNMYRSLINLASRSTSSWSLRANAFVRAKLILFPGSQEWANRA